jgi:Ca2+-binding RTX toxin-like protein
MGWGRLRVGLRAADAGWETIMPQTYVPAGGEFSLSNTTSGAQRSQHVYTLPNGNLFATWFDAASSKTFGRVFEPDGDPVTAEFQLPFVPGDLAPLPGGGFIATRLSGSTVTAQFLDAAGAAVGSPVTVVTNPGELIDATFVDALPNGHFIAFWQLRFAGLFWQEYDATGAKVGAEMHDLDGDTLLRSGDPQVLAFASGAFAIGYELDTPSSKPEGPFPTQLWFKFYDASHTLLATVSLPLQDGHEIDWDAALLDGGGFIATYATSFGGSIVAQRFDEAGNKVGLAVEVAHAVDGTHLTPSVIGVPGGGFVIAWTDSTPGDGDDSGTAIKALYFDADGVPVGPELLVNNGTTGDQTVPDLAVGAGGEVFVTWTTVASGNEDVVAQRLELGTSSFPVTDGTSGGETLNGTAAAEQINGLGGNDHLIGNGGNDVLDGGDGDDFIVGNLAGDGIDRLVGGDGNDFLLVDRNDNVVELAGGGYDNVCADENYRLGAGVEAEVLSTLDHHGTAAIDLTGNELFNIVIGNDGANVLDGGLGPDRLAGMGGDDSLIVDIGDYVDEQIGGGFDTVMASTDYVLNAGAEVEAIQTLERTQGPTSVTTEPIDLTGNEFSQRITGNFGSNVLDGGSGGVDTLVGLRGDDFYLVDSDDIVIEESDGGYDNVCARADYVLGAGVQAEVLSTDNHAGTAATDLTGNELAQVVLGNAGDNILDGGLGNDRLAGFGGNDAFLFKTALGASNVDTIADMNAGDTIRLDHAIFAALGTGALAAGAFVNGTAAGDADDRIIYDAATGRLWYDADGNGATAVAVQFATIENHFALGAGDFAVI